VEALELLLNRDSALKLREPAPDEGALQTILRCAVRAPDHGRLRPWRFVVVRQDKLGAFGKLHADSLARRNPAADAVMLQREAEKVNRAPLILTIAARVLSNSKIPDIEQVMAVAAAAQNVMLAAQALGFGAMWKTGDCAYDAEFRIALGLQPSDRIVGFIYLGTRVGGASPLPKAQPENITSYWDGPHN
jgi:nitroreductase